MLTNSKQVAGYAVTMPLPEPPHVRTFVTVNETTARLKMYQYKLLCETPDDVQLHAAWVYNEKGRLKWTPRGEST